MPEQDPPPNDMLEWGNPPTGPDMVSPAPPVAAEPGQEPQQAPAQIVAAEPAQRPGPVAYSLLAIGFGLALAAQYLPWTSVKTGAADQGGDDSVVSSSRRLPDSIDVHLANLSAGHVMTYLTTLALALVAIAVLLLAGGVVRRIAAATAAGLLAGNVLVLVGLKAAIDSLGANPSTSYLIPEDAISTGAGYPLAYASALLLAAGVVAAVRGPLLGGRTLGGRMFGGRPGRRKAEEPVDGEPLDLTVTAVPPTQFP